MLLVLPDLMKMFLGLPDMHVENVLHPPKFGFPQSSQI